MAVDFAHAEVDSEVHSFAGRYEVVREVRLPFRGREVLCVVGYCVVDNSCCGAAEFLYGLVPGYVESWREPREGGSAVSRVEPIRDEAAQRELAAIIERQERVTQVKFL